MTHRAFHEAYDAFPRLWGDRVGCGDRGEGADEHARLPLRVFLDIKWPDKETPVVYIRRTDSGGWQFDDEGGFAAKLTVLMSKDHSAEMIVRTARQLGMQVHGSAISGSATDRGDIGRVLEFFTIIASIAVAQAYGVVFTEPERAAATT